MALPARSAGDGRAGLAFLTNHASKDSTPYLQTGGLVSSKAMSLNRGCALITRNGREEIPPD